jgi:hypothetical protein
MDTFLRGRDAISHKSSLALDHDFLIDYLDEDLVTGCSLPEHSI